MGRILDELKFGDLYAQTIRTFQSVPIKDLNYDGIKFMKGARKYPRTWKEFKRMVILKAWQKK